MEIKKTLRNIGLAALVGAFSLMPAKADDILRGTRGPTSFQVENRVSYSQNERKTESITDTALLKYWNGDKLGINAFTIIPYKGVSSPTINDNGISDITLGIGPRGRLGNVHCSTWLAITLPTGKTNIGNDRTDRKVGGAVTYLTTDSAFESDIMAQYSYTGTDHKNVDLPNEFYIGSVAGGKIGKSMRGVAGADLTQKNNKDYVLNAKLALRYIFSPKFNLQIVGEKSLQSKNVPRYNLLEVYAKYNF